MSKEARTLFQAFLPLGKVLVEEADLFSSFNKGVRAFRFISTSVAFFVCSFCWLFLSSCNLLAASYRTDNFFVRADSSNFARKVGNEAERLRVILAELWLGQPLPRWSSPCEISIKTAENMPAGGETIFTFSKGEVYGWQMNVQGTEERILDSVLPHEITHTIIATYLRAPAPRWLDEGMATSVESRVERSYYRSLLTGFLKSKRGIAFNKMVSMKEYPDDLDPFYSQSFSVCEYLILVGGHRRLLEFAREGLESEDWNYALQKYYDCASLGALQMEWIEWIRKWDEANCPVELPNTRKLPDFVPEHFQDVLLAHNERLSVPRPIERGNYDEVSNESRNPAMRMWENARGWLRSDNNDDQTGRLSRAQDAQQYRQEPNAPFGGLPHLGGIRAPQQGNNRRNVGNYERQNYARNDSYYEGDEYDYAEKRSNSIPERVGQRANAAFENPQFENVNIFANGAGSAVRDERWEYERGASTPEYYSPAAKSVYSDRSRSY